MFDDGLGGFSALKDEAAEANSAAKRNRGDPLADALAQADALRPDQSAARGPRLPKRRDEPAGDAPAVDAFDFAEALRAVLAGPHAEAQPPKQVELASNALDCAYPAPTRRAFPRVVSWRESNAFIGCMWRG